MIFDDEQVEHFKSAALAYCGKVRQQPFEVVMTPHPTLGLLDENGNPQLIRREVWKFVADDLIDLSLKLTSIREGQVQDMITQGKMQL